MAMQEALELVLDVSRDQRLVLLEASIVVIELALSLRRRGQAASPQAP